jgi:hypothetical protein
MKVSKHGQGAPKQDADSLSGSVPAPDYQNTKAKTMGSIPGGKPHAKIMSKGKH